MQAEYLKQLPLFSHLNEANLRAIAVNVERKTHPKNTIIFREGEPAYKLFIVGSGLVKIFRLSTQGKEHIVNIMTQNNIIAEVPVFTGGKYPANCMALNDVVLFSIPRQNFITLIKHDPQIALNILALQAERLQYFTNKIEQLSLKTTRQKFLNFIQRNSITKNKITIVKTKGLSIQELANYLGTTRENLSRSISRLIKNKIIKKCPEGFMILSQSNLLSEDLISA